VRRTPSTRPTAEEFTAAIVTAALAYEATDTTIYVPGDDDILAIPESAGVSV
jgi:hypothetical protein